MGGALTLDGPSVGGEAVLVCESPLSSLEEEEEEDDDDDDEFCVSSNGTVLNAADPLSGGGCVDGESNSEFGPSAHSSNSSANTRRWRARK